MSELKYYAKALKRFKLSKLKIYASTIPDRINMHRYFRFTKASEKSNADYICVRGGNEHYVCRCDDIAIPMYMYNTGKTYSDEEIENFFRLSKKYYGYGPAKGDIFLDIGANIGTTSVYVARNISKEMSIYSFEPEPENYRLLRTNSIINQCDNINAFNVAVSDKMDKLKLEVTARNRGANRIISDETARNEFPDEVVEVDSVTIDEFLKGEKIDPARIKYIWMDVEGHEPQAIFGMRNLLENYRIPIYMEFTPDVSSRETVKAIQDLFAKKYSRFTAFGCNDYVKDMEITELMKLYDDNSCYQYELFLY